MQELLTPSLFDSPAPAPPRQTADPARDFIRWCSSFGVEFRNSPDVINLRSWAQQTGVKLKDLDEAEVLVEARRLYLKRIDQLVKKSETPALATSD